MYLDINVELDSLTKNRINDMLTNILNHATVDYKKYRKNNRELGAFYSVFIQPYLSVFRDDVLDLLHDYLRFHRRSLVGVKLSFAVSEKSVINYKGFLGGVDSCVYTANTDIILSFLGSSTMSIELNGAPVITQSPHLLVESCVVKILDARMLDLEI